MINKLAKLKQNQEGMVAIMVAIFLVLIISLVVINYSRLVRREQRQVLDRQLNTQALYVAESGIDHIRKQLTDPDVPTDFSKPDCGDLVLADYEITNLALESGTLEVTCSIVDTSLSTIRFDGVSDEYEVTPIDANGTPINEITIEWKNEGNLDVSGCGPPGFPNSLPATCTPGVLKVDLVDTTTISRDTLLNNMFTAYLYPNNGGSSDIGLLSARGSVNQGVIRNTDCSSDLCSMTITGLSSARYHIRFKSIYNISNVTISAFDSSGNPLSLVGAQASIDVTAKAVDVIRRIKVTVPISGYVSSNSMAEAPLSAALEVADSICKRYSVSPFVDAANPGSISADGTCLVP